MQPDSNENDSVDQTAVEAIDQPASTDLRQPIHWEANEYIHHEKSSTWFVIFGIIIVVLTVFAWLILQSWTFAILVPVMGAALLVYTKRPPRVLEYTLSEKGLYINDQLYGYGEFKGFGVIKDGQEYSIMLIPVKRFHIGVSVYFPEEAGEAIVDILGARLPILKLSLDFIDKITRKLRI